MNWIDEIKLGESKTIEFKEKIPSNNSIAKSAISFSNTGGGKLFLGINNNGDVKGLDKSVDIIAIEDRIAQLIYDNCAPVINFEIYTANINEKYVLVLDIKRGNDGPYYLKSKGIEHGTYIRVGATNRLADNQKIKSLRLISKNISYDQLINLEYKLEELKLDSLEKEFSKIDKNLDTEKLKNLGLVQKNNDKYYPTNGLLILLGKFEHCIIKSARFKGTDMVEFLDKAEFHGNIFKQLKDAINFVKKHINYEGRIEGLQRTDRYEIPLVAIRESVVNALIHRDYENYGRDIKLGVYDDIVNIVSPGGFPLSITEKDLLKGRSEIRNKVIARVFKELGYIEQWGSGVKRIIASCESYDLKKPDIRETGDSVDVCLYRRTSIKESKVKAEAKENFDLNEQEKQIIDYLSKKESIKRNDVERILGVKKSRAYSILDTLSNKDIIKKVGRSSSTRYILNK